MIEWLLTALSDIDVWERNTRARRGDDEVIAEYRAVCRRAGYSILATTSMVTIAMAWAVFGPSAGSPPYRGLSVIFLWTDRIIAGLVLVSILLAVLRCYQAFTFHPQR